MLGPPAPNCNVVTAAAAAWGVSYSHSGFETATWFAYAVAADQIILGFLSVLKSVEGEKASAVPAELEPAEGELTNKHVAVARRGMVSLACQWI